MYAQVDREMFEMDHTYFIEFIFSWLSNYAGSAFLGKKCWMSTVADISGDTFLQCGDIYKYLVPTIIYCIIMDFVYYSLKLGLHSQYISI